MNEESYCVYVYINAANDVCMNVIRFYIKLYKNRQTELFTKKKLSKYSIVE